MEYFLHPTHDDTTNADRDVAAVAIACPPVAECLPNLVRNMREHREADLGVMI